MRGTGGCKWLMSFQKSHLRPTRDLTALARRTPDWCTDLQILHLNGITSYLVLSLPLSRILIAPFVWRSPRWPRWLWSFFTSDQSIWHHCLVEELRHCLAARVVANQPLVVWPLPLGQSSRHLKRQDVLDVLRHEMGDETSAILVVTLNPCFNLARRGAAGRWPTRMKAAWRLGRVNFFGDEQHFCDLRSPRPSGLTNSSKSWTGMSCTHPALTVSPWFACVESAYDESNMPDPGLGWSLRKRICTGHKKRTFAVHNRRDN